MRRSQDNLLLLIAYDIEKRTVTGLGVMGSGVGSG